MRLKKLPVHVYICPKPLKIGKLGVPEGEKIAEVDGIKASDPYRTEHKYMLPDNILCLYAPSQKKILRKYEVDDWGRIERI